MYRIASLLFVPLILFLNLLIFHSLHAETFDDSKHYRIEGKIIYLDYDYKFNIYQNAKVEIYKITQDDFLIYLDIKKSLLFNEKKTKKVLDASADKLHQVPRTILERVKEHNRLMEKVLSGLYNNHPVNYFYTDLNGEYEFTLYSGGFYLVLFHGPYGQKNFGVIQIFPNSQIYLRSCIFYFNHYQLRDAEMSRNE